MAPLVMLGSSSKPQRLVTYMITAVNNRCSTVYCFPAFLYIVSSHPIMSTKHPSGPLAPGEKRKAITIEMELKIIAQLQANVSALSTFKVG